MAAADRTGVPADVDFRVERLPANTHLCIDAVGGQHFIFKTDTKRIGLHVNGGLATLGPVRLTFSTVGMSGVSKAIDEFALLTEILFPDPGKTAPKAKSRPVTRIELRDALIGLDGTFEKKVLAARLGMAPEVLSRSFSALLPYKVKVSGATIEIRDVDALTKLAQPTPTIDDPSS